MTDDTYVHDPDELVDDNGASSDGSSDATSTEGEAGASAQPRNVPDPGDREFDWRGWLLVGAIVFAFLVVPGALYALPFARETVASLGLSLRDTYLVLPLLPAFLLGSIAVWSAVRSRSR